MGYFLFLLLLLFWFFVLFLIYDNSTLGPSCRPVTPSPVHHPGSQTRLSNTLSLGFQEPCQPQPSSPCSTGYGSDQGLLLSLPSCPMEQPGCSKGARRAWLGSQDKGSGLGHPGKVAPPCLAPFPPPCT
uniref:Uncharacterized protein n=1 Tax=Mus spicilegus TaxID=10103 RepID=A0A8C6HMT4_MUSSI